ncbi:20412_t:CDS:1, partial [Gigaspora rosea]
KKNEGLPEALGPTKEHHHGTTTLQQHKTLWRESDPANINQA